MSRRRATGAKSWAIVAVVLAGVIVTAGCGPREDDSSTPATSEAGINGGGQGTEKEGAPPPNPDATPPDADPGAGDPGPK